MEDGMTFSNPCNLFGGGEEFRPMEACCGVVKHEKQRKSITCLRAACMASNMQRSNLPKNCDTNTLILARKIH